MSLSAAQDDSPAAEIHLPAEIDWHMLDKSRFFFLGAALFSAVSGALYPIVVLKTRQQVSQVQLSCIKTAHALLRYEGLRGFYRGFGTSLTGTIPARALYMAALEVTKSNIGDAAMGLGFSETTASAVANAAAGLSSAIAAQLVWTPIDVVSQRLMVQDSGTKSIFPSVSSYGYRGGIDAFRKIVHLDGLRGLYKGFGISLLTYAPSNAVWWSSYSVAQKFIWGGIGSYVSKRDEVVGLGGGSFRPDSTAVVAMQAVSAAVASGVSAVVTMPLDTIKTRIQVLDRGGSDRRPPGVVRTARNLVKAGGLAACYRGLGPRWASMSISAAAMVTTYEMLKRLSAKGQESLAL